jgi:hypothetical protein
MQKNKDAIHLVAVILLLNACVATKKMFYSYETNWYSIDSAKHLISPTRVISYGDYMFEFKIRTNINTEIYPNPDSVVSSTSYDTIGVYLISKEKQNFFEFDTFDLKSNIVKSGKWTEKETGTSLKSLEKDLRPNNSANFSSQRDTIINNILCFYSSTFSKKSDGDTIEEKLISVKNRYLNSLYKIQGMKFEDDSFCIVGFSFFDPKSKEMSYQDINNLRLLTEKERQICESMVRKAKQKDK